MTQKASVRMEEIRRRTRRLRQRRTHRINCTLSAVCLFLTVGIASLLYQEHVPGLSIVLAGYGSVLLHSGADAYIVSDLRKINVYGDVAHQPLCSYYGKLNELPQALFENGFLRVGRSAVVNMKYIRQISSYMVTLRNGVKLGVSRNGYAEIRSTYLEWKGQFGDD